MKKVKNKFKNGIFSAAAFFMLIWLIWVGRDCSRYSFAQAFSQDDFFLEMGGDVLRGTGQFEPGFYFDPSIDGTALYSGEMLLKKGIYEVSVLAETNNSDRECCTEVIPLDDTSGGSYSHLIDSDAVGIENGRPTTYRIHVNHDTEARIKCTAEETTEVKYVLLESAQITYLAGKTFSWRFSKSIVGCGILLLLLWIGLFRKDRAIQFAENNAYAITAIAGCTLIAMYPFTNHLLIFGDDMLYHLNRIVHLGEGLKNGAFPVRIHPGWAGEFGYAAGVGYCDLFLVPSALMYQMGYTLSVAYRFYVLLMTVLTALCSEYAFRRISHDQLIGAVCCAIYTLLPYRLYNVYSGATVGEYGAYTFLPLVVLGLYDIYFEEEKLQRGWLILAAGISCVLETHILTTFILALIIPIFCLILWKKTFTKEIFTALCKTVGTILAVNLWFLLPLCDYLLLQGFEGTWKVYLWDNGFPASDLLFNIRDHSGFRCGTIGSGLIVVFILIVCLVLLCKREYGRYNTAMGIMWGCSALLLYMSTISFPYWGMHRLFPLLDKLLSNIQFPYRLINPAAAMIVFMLAFSGRTVLEKNGKQYAYILVGALLVLSMDQTTEYLTNVVNDGHCFTAYDEVRVGNGNPVEFLLEDTSLGVIDHSGVEALSEQVSAVLTDRKGTHLTAHITNNGDAAETVLFPLWSYRYYIAKAEGTKLPVSTHTDKRIAVEVPAHFDGSVEVLFREPVIWRLSEMISVVAVAWLIIRIKKKKNMNG